MIKVAFVGCGRISERHYEAVRELDQVDLVAVCDPRFERAVNLGNKANCPSFTGLQQMLLEIPNIDLLVVMVESGKHFDVAMELLPHEIPVLIEKPLTLQFDSARKLVQAYHEANVPLFVVKQNRLNPPVVDALEGLKSGRSGSVLSLNASVLWCRPAEYYLQDEWRLLRNQDGGVLWNQASHYVDLVSLILGEVTSVFAFGENYLSPAETEDTVHAVLRSKSGAIASIQASTCARPKNFEGNITIVAENEVVKIGGHALNTLQRSTESDLTLRKEVLSDQENGVYGKGHAGVYQSIIFDIQGGGASQFRAQHGLQVVALMEAIHLSISEGREVQLAEIASQS